MLQFFRNFFKTRLGIAITLAFVGLVGLAFAVSDVASHRTFGGVAGGDQAAVVGDEKISTDELSRAATSAVEDIRQRDPTISMPAFLERDGLKQVLDQLIERAALSTYASKYGLRAGSNLVNSEIIAMDAFRGPSGNFDQKVYEQLIRQRGLTDAMVRTDLAAGLLAKQLLVPAAFGARMPDRIAMQYASLFKHSRTGGIALLPSAAFAPKDAPNDATLKTYYDANKGEFIRPERRIIRYFTFGENAITTSIEPTAAEIAARYAKDKELYAPSEKRMLTQLIVPTRQQAEAIKAKVAAGGSLEAAARAAGLQVAKIGSTTEKDYAAKSSADVAKAAFAAKSGTIADIARSGLGYHVVQVDKVVAEPGRTLAQATPDITKTLREEKRRAALTDMASRIEDELDSGGALSELAKEFKAEIIVTKPLVGTGQVYDAPGEKAADVLTPALSTAFQMEEGKPQLAEVDPGKTFLVYEVSRITPSAPAPLGEIRNDVVARWKIAEGSKAAKAAADRIMQRMKGGMTLAAAMAAEKRPLPPVENIAMSRDQLQAMQGGVPPPLALLFSMAQRTTKRLEAPRGAGWFVVHVDTITPGKIAPDDPQLEVARRDLAQLAGREYGDQLRAAIRKEVGVDKNDAAVAALRKRLAGDN